MTEKRDEEMTDLRELITTIERMAMMIKDEYILDVVSYLRRISEKCGCSIQRADPDACIFILRCKNTETRIFICSSKIHCVNNSEMLWFGLSNTALNFLRDSDRSFVIFIDRDENRRVIVPFKEIESEMRSRGSLKKKTSHYEIRLIRISGTYKTEKSKKYLGEFVENFEQLFPKNLERREAHQ